MANHQKGTECQPESVLLCFVGQAVDKGTLLYFCTHACLPPTHFLLQDAFIPHSFTRRLSFSPTVSIWMIIYYDCALDWRINLNPTHSKNSTLQLMRCGVPTVLNPKKFSIINKNRPEMLMFHLKHKILAFSSAPPFQISATHPLEASTALPSTVFLHCH